MNVENPIRNIVLIVRKIAPTIIHGLYVQFNSVVSDLCSLNTSNICKDYKVYFLYKFQKIIRNKESNRSISQSEKKPINAK